MVALFEPQVCMRGWGESSEKIKEVTSSLTNIYVARQNAYYHAI